MQPDSKGELLTSLRSTERRRTARVASSCEVHYKSQDSKGERRALTKDISLGGACLILKEELPEAAQTLSLIHPRGNHPLQLNARSVWSSRLPKSLDPTSTYLAVGVEFTQAQEEALKELDRFIAQDLAQREEDEKLGALGRLNGRLGAQRAEAAHRLPRTALACIAGAASYLPPQKVTNDDIVHQGLESSATAIYRGLGVMERRAADPTETSIDMMVKVAQKILAEKKLDPKGLDRIICSVDPPEGVAPNAAAFVQERIGAKCPAYEISMSCAGWACGVDDAVRSIATGEERILVLAANRVGSVLPFKNLMHRAIFGDGAGGVLVTASNRSKILATSLWTDGSHYADIFVPLPWTKTPTSVPLDYNGYFYMNPEPGPFHDTMRNVMPREFDKLLRKAALTKDDIDLFLLHEPSKPLYELSLKLLGIPREKTFQNFECYGNTVSAEMPLLLDEAIRQKKVKEGNLILIFTYGAGFTMGSMIFEL